MLRLILCLPFLSCLGDVSRFISPLELNNESSNDSIVINALVSPSHSHVTPTIFSGEKNYTQKFFLDQDFLEAKMGEAILHRYQCNGTIKAQATRVWNPVKLSSNFILKIVDCMPDELAPSSFIRFELWDEGKLIGKFGEPFRLSHVVDVMVLREPISRGQVPELSHFTTKPIDILRGYADAIPANTSLEGYQMSSAVSIGSPLKWSNLSKVNLVRRGDVVDVFASGGGIFITMKGVSLDDGVQGGVIKIRNISSDKEFFAKVLNKNSVKVNL